MKQDRMSRSGQQWVYDNMNSGTKTKFRRGLPEMYRPVSRT